MNVNKVLAKDYENKTLGECGKNEPKTNPIRTQTNPIKANFRKAKMNVNSLITKDYRKKDDFAVRKNKAKTKPISEKPKMNVNKVLRGDYEDKSHFAAIAKQTQSNPISNVTLLKWVITRVKCLSLICLIQMLQTVNSK